MLYVVTRRDLAPGYQLAQSVHAGIDFAIAHPDLARSHRTLVCLEVADERALHDLRIDAVLAASPCVGFCEPDLSDQLTALALVPEPALERRLRSLRLSGRG